MDARVKDGKAKEEEEIPLLTTGPKVPGCETLLNSKFQCGSFLNPEFQSSSVCFGGSTPLSSCNVSLFFVACSDFKNKFCVFSVCAVEFRGLAIIANFMQESQVG